MRFRLIGNTTVFVAQRYFRNAAGIDCIHGVTEDGTRQTTARQADVAFLDTVGLGGAIEWGWSYPSLSSADYGEGYKVSIMFSQNAASSNP